MLVQNIYHDCTDCGSRQRLLSASPGYVITAKGSCSRCGAGISVKLGLITPFAGELVSLADPGEESTIFADQIRHRFVKFMDEADIRKLSSLLPENGKRVPVRLATMATLVWLVKDNGAGDLRTARNVEVHYLNASSARERATVLQQIIERWAPIGEKADS